MKRFFFYKFCFLILFCLSITKVYPEVKGSETVLSIEQYYDFLSTDTDNTMLGFGWFKNGFGLEDSSVTCTFDSVFPVSGDIYLNGGSLFLGTDLIFKNRTTWYTSGDIVGNDYLVDFSSSVTGLGSQTYEQTFDDTIVNINSDLIVSGTVKFKGNCLLNGNGKRILLDSDGYLVVDSNATVTFKDVHIDGLLDNKICMLSDESKIVFDDIRLIQDGDFYFNNGSFKIFNDVDLVGSYTFFYQSSQSSTIDTHSNLNISQGLKLSIGKKNGVDDIEPLKFIDETSVLNLENCCLSITPSGMSLLSGLMILDRGVEIEINSTNSTHGLILGDGTEDNNMNFRFHPGARVLFSKGDLIYKNTDPRSLRSRSGEAVFVRGQDSVFYLNEDVYLEGIALDTHPSSQLFVAEGKDLKYIGCRIIYPGIEFELGGSRYNDYTNLMSGDEEMFLLRGTLSPYTYVAGAGNILHGNGDISGKIILSDSNSELSMDVNGMISNDVVLNGGKLILTHNGIFTQDSKITGSGTVDLDEFTLTLGVNDLEYTDTLKWESSGGCIRIYSKLDLTPGSSLKIKRLVIDGIKDNNIRCMGGDSSVILDSVKWIQDDNYSFTVGSFAFYNHVDFIGSYTFSYESNNTSTIKEHSELHPMDGIRITLNRSDGVEPLYFEDNTSCIHLDNCTLATGNNGVCFTRGTILCHHEVFLDIDSTGSVNGFALGNNTSDGDIRLILESGAAVSFLRGDLVYNVTDPDALVARSTNSNLIRYGGTTFYVNEDLLISNFKMFDRNYTAAVVTADGKTVSYQNAVFEWPGVGMEITGQRYNYYTSLLAGNNELFLLKGVFASYVMVMGTNNIIHGDGALGGPIILTDPSASVQMKINGDLIQDVYLSGGTIELLKDLRFSKHHNIADSGKVNLSEGRLKLGNVDQEWTGDIYWDGDGGCIGLHSKITLSGTWTVSGNCTIIGNDNTLDLSNGNIVIDKDSSLTLRDIRLEGISGNNIRCLDNTSSIVINNLDWLQDSDYSFTVGSISFEADNYFDGSYSFSYESAQTITINKNAGWMIRDSMRFFIGRNNSVEPLYFEDDTAMIKFSGCTFAINNNGMNLTRGIIGVNRDVVMEVNSTSSLNGLTLGDGTADGDITIQFFPASSLNFSGGDLVINQYRPNFIDLKQGNARLIRTGQNNLHVKSDMSLSNLIINSGLFSQTIVDDGKNLDYENCIVETIYTDFSVTGRQSAYFCNNLVGNGDFFLHKGTMPYWLDIWGTNNTLRGNGDMGGDVNIHESTASINFDLNGVMLGDINLGGGTVNLSSDLKLVSNKMFLGDGKVNLDTKRLELGNQDKVWTGTVYWDGSEGQIDLNSNIYLSGKWTFSGFCVLKGGWNVLVLDPAAEIYIEKGSTLMIKDLKIKGLSDGQLVCLDDNSYLKIYNAKTKLSNNYSFTHGYLDILEEFEVHGTYTFDYASSKRLAIGPCAMLRMKEGSTLSYNPPTTNRNLFELQHELSTIELDGATLHSTSTGLQLTGGYLLINGDSQIKSDAATLSEAVTFGDGVSISNNINISIEPSGNLSVASGYVRDRNVVQ